MQTINNIQDSHFAIIQRQSFTEDSSSTYYKSSTVSGPFDYSRAETSSTYFSTSSVTQRARNGSSKAERGNSTRYTFLQRTYKTKESLSSSSYEQPEYTYKAGTDTVTVPSTAESGEGSALFTYLTLSSYLSTNENKEITQSETFIRDNDDPDTPTYSSSDETTNSYSSSYQGIVYTSQGGTAFFKSTSQYTYSDTYHSISGSSLVSATSSAENTTMFNTLRTLNIPTLTTSQIAAQRNEKLGTRFFGAPGALLMHIDFTKPTDSYDTSNIHDYLKIAKTIDIKESTHRNISLVTEPAISLVTAGTQETWNSVGISYYVPDHFSIDGAYTDFTKSTSNYTWIDYSLRSEEWNGHTYPSSKDQGTVAKTTTTNKTIFNSGKTDSENITTTIFDGTSGKRFYASIYSTLTSDTGIYFPYSESIVPFESTFLSRKSINLGINESEILNNINYAQMYLSTQSTNFPKETTLRATYSEKTSSWSTTHQGGGRTRAGTSSCSPKPFTTEYFTQPKTPYVESFNYPFEQGGEGDAMWQQDWVDYNYKPPIPKPIQIKLHANDFGLTSIKNDYGHVSYLQGQTIGTDGSYYNKLEPSSFKIPLIGANYETGDCTNYAFHAVAPAQQSSYFIARFLSTNSDGTLISYSTDLNKITSLSYTDSNLEVSALSSTLIKISQEQGNPNWGSSVVDGATRFTKDRDNVYYSEQSIRTATNSNAYDTSGPESFSLSFQGNKSQIPITNDFGDLVPSSRMGLEKTKSLFNLTAIGKTFHDAQITYQYDNKEGTAFNIFNFDYFTAGGILDNGEPKSITFFNKVNAAFSKLEMSYYDRQNSSLISSTINFNGSFSTEGSQVTTYKPIIGKSINPSLQDTAAYSAPHTLAGERTNFNNFSISIAGGLNLTTVNDYNISRSINRNMSPELDYFNSIVVAEIKPNTEILGLGEASHLPASEVNFLPIGAYKVKNLNSFAFSTVNQLAAEHTKMDSKLIYQKTASGIDNPTGSNWTTTGQVFGFDSKFGNKMY